MEVILLKHLDSVRKADDIINVKPGYARNYLIPCGIAIAATPLQKKLLSEKLQQSNKKREELVKQAEVLVSRLQSTKITIPVKASEEGKLFGSITSLQVAEALNKYYSIRIDSKDIIIEEPIKELGTYNILINALEGISANVEISVVTQGKF
jgi:large subunit ribosomal protein L9